MTPVATTTRYTPHELERRWQDAWDAAGVFRAERLPTGPKWYVMDLPPFANGTLHLGHVRNYVIADASARFHRLLGDSVLYTSGFDVFGLPSDIAAAEAGCHPKDLCDVNVARITAQFRRLGLSHDVERVTDYSDPEFYRWVQWVFVKLWEAGFVYRAEHEVNWCARCRTSVEDGLLTGDGNCWRCDQPVDARWLEQWFVRDTAVVEEVLDGLDALDQWPDVVKNIQRRFVDRVEGIEVAFDLDDGDSIQVFEETEDGVRHAAYVAVGRHHPLARRYPVPEGAAPGLVDGPFADEATSRLLKDPDARRARYANVAVKRLAVSARNPLTGQWLPVVVLDPWTAAHDRAVLGVPDARALDAHVARRIPEPAGGNGAPARRPTRLEGADPDDLAGRALIDKGVRYRLRDWHVSRQRYWGAPVPAVHCPHCGAVPVPEAELPIELPLDVDTTSAANPLVQEEQFVVTTCPSCGARARRDTDTLGAYSSPWWYMWSARPPDAINPFSDPGARAWQPVDLMVGGLEQSTACFFHVRVIARLLLQLHLVEHAEPVTRLLALGMLRHGGVKMSKSGDNAISPDDLVDRFGADAVRLAVLGAAAPANSYEWSTDMVERRHAWLARLWDVTFELIEALPTLDVGDTIVATSAGRSRLQRAVAMAEARATSAYHRDAYHLAVKDLGRLFESLIDFRTAALDEGDLCETDARAMAAGLRTLVRLLAPMAPHIAEELWSALGGATLLAGRAPMARR